MSSPRVSPVEQEFLRSSGSEYGFDVVDLPVLFSEFRNEGVAPSGLFLDYCHLTAEGIDLAMMEVASAVIERLSGISKDSLEIRSTIGPLCVPAAVEARARLGAAVHTAHRALPLGEVHAKSATSEIERWCRAAVAVDRAALVTLRTLAQVRLSGAGTSDTADTSVLDPRVFDLLHGRHELSPQHGLLWNGLDGSLVCAIDRILSELEGRGLDFSTLQEPIPGNRAATSWWLSSPLEQIYSDALDREGQKRCVHFRAAWPTTTFWTGPAQADVELRLVLRTPWAKTDRSVSVSLNGTEQGRVPADKAWESRTLRLPARDFGDRLNRLTISWPIPSGGQTALQAARDNLQQGHETDLHPIFGELHSLSLHPG